MTFALWGQVFRPPLHLGLCAGQGRGSRMPSGPAGLVLVATGGAGAVLCGQGLGRLPAAL